VGFWAFTHKPLAIGAGVATTAALAAGAYALWKKVIEPKIKEAKKKKLAQEGEKGEKGKLVKRAPEDELLDHLMADEEFISFLEGLAEHIES
jgi:hypothetical protein